MSRSSSRYSKSTLLLILLLVASSVVQGAAIGGNTPKILSSTELQWQDAVI
jgi:hypothetical protein